jgi:hypothetical protein
VHFYARLHVIVVNNIYGHIMIFFSHPSLPLMNYPFWSFSNNYAKQRGP